MPHKIHPSAEVPKKEVHTLLSCLYHRLMSRLKGRTKIEALQAWLQGFKQNREIWPLFRIKRNYHKSWKKDCLNNKINP